MANAATGSSIGPLVPRPFEVARRWESPCAVYPTKGTAVAQTQNWGAAVGGPLAVRTCLPSSWIGTGRTIHEFFSAVDRAEKAKKRGWSADGDHDEQEAVGPASIGLSLPMSARSAADRGGNGLQWSQASGRTSEVDRRGSDRIFAPAACCGLTQVFPIGSDSAAIPVCLAMTRRIPVCIECARSTPPNGT